MKLVVIVCACLSLVACSTTQLPRNLSHAILSNNDLELVAAALPSYLITVDALVSTYPKNANILTTAAELNSAYAGVFVEQPERQQQYSAKAFLLAQKATCRQIKSLCDVTELHPDELHARLTQLEQPKHAASLHLLGSVWASYIQAHSQDWNAIAQLAQVQAILEHQVQLSPGYNHAMGELYLAVLSSLLPPALGGQPELAREYFEQALRLSEDRNLIIAVYYAEQYAKLIFDAELYRQLLNQVLTSNPQQGALTLQNTYAQQLARELLAEMDSYFF